MPARKRNRSDPGNGGNSKQRATKKQCNEPVGHSDGTVSENNTTNGATHSAGGTRRSTRATAKKRRESRAACSNSETIAPGPTQKQGNTQRTKRARRNIKNATRKAVESRSVDNQQRHENAEQQEADSDASGPEQLESVAQGAGGQQQDIEGLKQSVEAIERSLYELASTVSIIAQDRRKEEHRNAQQTNDADLAEAASGIENYETFRESGMDLERYSGELVDIPRQLTISTEEKPVQFSCGLPLGTQIPDSIKQKVWSYKYVDFSTLLDPDIEDSYSLSIEKLSQTPRLNLNPKAKKFLDESQWASAFDIYVAIYCMKYPNQLQELLSYGNTIKRLMKNKSRWWVYDKQFRLTRQYSKCSWANIRVDLYLNCQTATESRNFRNFRRFEAIPRGYCYRYHSKEQACRNEVCKFSHACIRCKRQHPMYAKCYGTYQRQQRQYGEYRKGNTEGRFNRIFRRGNTANTQAPASDANKR